MIRAVLFLWALSLPALAATGTSAAENWFVRPAGDCANNGDGLAYSCAASAGASGAFRTFLNPIWTTTTGIDDGDTLYVCGNFVAADQRNSTTMLDSNVTAIVSAPATIDGDCSTFGGPAMSTIDAQGASQYSVLLDGSESYVRVRNLNVCGGTVAGVYLNAATGTGNELRNIRVGCGSTGIGVAVDGTAWTLSGIRIPGGAVTSDAVNVETTAVSGTIVDSEIHSANAAGSDTIEIQGDSITSVTIERNTLVHHHEDKSTLTIKQGTGLYVIRDNVFDGGGTNGYGLRTESTFDGDLIVQRNIFQGYTGDQANHIQLDGKATSGSPTASIVGNAHIGGYDQIVWGNYWSVQAYHNTMRDPEHFGLYSGGTLALGPILTDIRNNVLSGNERFIESFGYEDAMTLDGNAYVGAGDFRINNTVYANLAAVQAATAYEDNGIAPASAQWHGGESPTEYAQFRPRRTSPLCGAGIQALTGVTRSGKRLGATPDIGAFQCWSFPQ